MRCERFLVRGMVQGVGYRLWTVRKAEELELTGYVRNLPDGSVEVVARGEKDAVDALATLCEKGPWSARVDDVTRTPCHDRELAGSGFRVRH